jgi:hypothetical protein
MVVGGKSGAAPEPPPRFVRRCPGDCSRMRHRILLILKEAERLDPDIILAIIETTPEPK